MELSAAIRRRRMCRRYDPDVPVRPEQLDAVLSAMLRAPSAGHTQGVSFLVWADAADRDRFWALTDPTAERAPTDAGSDPPAAVPAALSGWLAGMRTAVVLIAVWTSRETYLDRYAEPDKGWTDRDPDRWSAPYWWVDAGMAAYAGLVTAVDQGLGACFFGVPPERVDAVREAFSVPAEQWSVGVLSLGVPAPDEAVAGSARRRARRDASSRVFNSTWGTPYEVFGRVSDRPL